MTEALWIAAAAFASFAIYRTGRHAGRRWILQRIVALLEKDRAEDLIDSRAHMYAVCLVASAMDGGERDMTLYQPPPFRPPRNVIRETFVAAFRCTVPEGQQGVEDAWMACGYDAPDGIMGVGSTAVEAVRSFTQERRRQEVARRAKGEDCQ